MKTETLLKQLREIEDFGMQEFWCKDYGGSCPCFSGHKIVESKKIEVWGRCWRSGERGQELYVDGDLPQIEGIALEIKRALDNQRWYNPYILIVNGIDILPSQDKETQ